MKKLLSTFLFAITLINGYYSPKAEAGVYLFYEAQQMDLPGVTGTFFMVCGAGWGVFGLVKQNPLALFGGMALIALDEKQNRNQGVLEKYLFEKYPFIDNQEAIKNLSKTVQSQFPNPLVSEKEYVISVAPELVKAALEAADLSPEQVKIVTNDLK